MAAGAADPKSEPLPGWPRPLPVPPSEETRPSILPLLRPPPLPPRAAGPRPDAPPVEAAASRAGGRLEGRMREKAVPQTVGDWRLNEHIR